MTGTVIRAAVLLSAVAAAAPVDVPVLIKQALQRFQSDERSAGEYGWTRRSQKTEFNSDGSVKSRATTVTQREPYDGFMISRVVERNGKPLDDIERDRSEAALHRRIGELKSMTPEQVEKLQAERRKKQAEEDAWIGEASAALEFKLVGEEAVARRPAFVLDVSPRPGYKTSNMRARVFEKLRGRVWIDKADTEMAKADIEIFDLVSIGFGLMARIEKGTRFLIQRTRVSDAAWMPELQRVRVDGRFLLFKSMNEEIVSSFSGYAHKPDAIRTD
jgi:hypothetical protein